MDSKKLFRLCSRMMVTAFTFLIIAAYSGLAQAEQPSDFYQGKTMVLIVPYSPGGGYDLYARTLAPYLKKYTGASVIVKNMPGAGSLLAANYLYNTAKADGLTIQITNTSGLAISDFLKEKSVRYDLQKFNWLGKTCDYNEIVVVSAARPYRTVKELKSASRVKFGATVRTVSYGYMGAVFAFAAGLENFRIISGYGGASEMTAAMLRGETDGQMASQTAANQFIKSGDFIPVVSMSFDRLAAMPKIPTIYDAVPDMPQNVKQIVDKMITITSLQRVLATAPGVPKDRVDFLRTCMVKTLHDPGLLSDVKKLGLLEPVMYTSGDKVLSELEKAILKITPEEKKTIKSLILEKYK